MAQLSQSTPPLTSGHERRRHRPRATPPDGQIKNRPVVLLRHLPPFGDLLVCGVSTQLQHRVADFDELLMRDDPEFSASGLKATSLIRLGFLAVLPEAGLLGRIGSLSHSRHRRLLSKLGNGSAKLVRDLSRQDTAKGLTASLCQY